MLNPSIIGPNEIIEGEGCLSEAKILIGTCGWQFPQWQTSYYPEGLPEDWQLAYYGNEYPVVLLPAAFWLQDEATIKNWREELAERPAFIAEWVFTDDAGEQAAIRDGLVSVADRVLGVLVSLKTKPDAAQRQVIRELAVDSPVVLDWPTAAAEFNEVQAELGSANSVGCCWHGDSDQLALLDAGTLLLTRTSSAGQTPRSLRSVIEAVIAKAGERQAVILFDGDPPDLDVVDQAEVILNLL